MVFLVNDDHISSAMNNATAFLSTSATISWHNVNGSTGGCVGGGGGGGGGSDANASGGEGNGANFSVCDSNLTDEAVLIEQLVSKATLGKVTLAFGLVLIPLFALVGVVGNVLSLVVLVQHRMRSTINLCLAALAVSDLLLLLHSLAFSAMRIYGQHDPDGADRARVTTYQVLGAYGSIVSARITTWLTTMLGVERCIAVYFPMKAKAINSRRSTLLAITTIYLITILAFLPTTLQYKVIWVVTPRNQTHPKLVLSDLGRNHRFMVPYSLVLNILFRFIPLVTLVVVNALIAVAIRRTRAMRRNMSWGSGVGSGLSDGGGGVNGGGSGASGGRSHGSGHEQNRITMMLLTVSAVFLVCTLPGAINTIVSRITAHYSRLGAQGNLYMTLSLVTYFLETLNSSVNFVIYMAFSRKFCHTYQEIFCRRSKHWKMSLRTVRFTPRGGGVGGGGGGGAAGMGVGGGGGGIGGGRGLGGSGRGGGASSSTPHEMYCMQYRPLTPATHSPVNNNHNHNHHHHHHHHHSSSSGGGGSGSGSHPRARFIISNGFARSSFDVDDVQLIGNGVGKRGVSNGGLPIHGACCTCRLGNRSHSLSRSRSQSRSRSHSHSSDSAAQQYS